MARRKSGSTRNRRHGAKTRRVTYYCNPQRQDVRRRQMDEVIFPYLEVWQDQDVTGATISEHLAAALYLYITTHFATDQEMLDHFLVRREQVSYQAEQVVDLLLPHLTRLLNQIPVGATQAAPQTINVDLTDLNRLRQLLGDAPLYDVDADTEEVEW